MIKLRNIRRFMRDRRFVSAMGVMATYPGTIWHSHIGSNYLLVAVVPQEHTSGSILTGTRESFGNKQPDCPQNGYCSLSASTCQFSSAS